MKSTTAKKFDAGSDEDEQGRSPEEFVTDDPDDDDGRGLNLKLYMKVECDLEQEIGKAVEIPAGLRRKVRYKEGNQAVTLFRDWCIWSTTDPQKNGSIRSGANWVLVRRDGVMVLDSHVTLGFPAKDQGPDEPEYLVDATFKGMIDLKDSFGCEMNEAYDEFVSGNKGITRHKLNGSVRFQTAERASLDLDTSWLPKHLQKTVERFGDFAPLVRQQFVASGVIQVRHAPCYPPEKIIIHVWGV